jgi:hypothetical protein
MNVIIAFVLGGIIGILACYAWMKGFLKDAGVK